MAAVSLLGVGFHDRPSPRRPIWLAHGLVVEGGLELAGFEQATSLAHFELLLAAPGPWLGAFDFPFGLARELVEARAWPLRWEQLVPALERLGRVALAAQLRDFCAGRPRGRRFALRATERVAGAQPAMGRIGTRHALRCQAGAPRLLSAGVAIPGIREGDSRRIALEGNPALAAMPVTRGVWRSGVRSGRGDVRELERERLVDALERGHPSLGVQVRLARADRAAVIADDRGGRLAALLCLAQAQWARGQANWGAPAPLDALEGWIVGAELASEPATP